MNDLNPAAPRLCRNENCVRAAEPGESYCNVCGLELSLFVRDLRPRRHDSGQRPPREAPRA